MAAEERGAAKPRGRGLGQRNTSKKLAQKKKKTIIGGSFKSLGMNFDKEKYRKEMEEVFNINKNGKQNFNKLLNKRNYIDAMAQCERDGGTWFNYDTGETNTILDNIDNHLPNNSFIDGTSKVDFQWRYTDTFPVYIQDKAYSRKYFLDCGVPEENLPKEYGVYASYEKFEEDIDNFKDKDIVIKYNCGADCEQVIRIKKGDIGEKQNEIKKLFEKKGGNNYVIGTTMKGFLKKLFVVQEDIAPGNENFPNDFKFWCINGKPAFCEVMTGRKSDLKCAFIDLTGKRMPLWHKFKKNMSDDELNKILSKLTKQQFEKMKELCEKVSKDIPLIRTDFCLGSDGEPKVIEAQDLYMMHLNNITFNKKSIPRNLCKISEYCQNGKSYMASIPDCKEDIDEEYKNNMEQVARTLGLKTGKYLTEPIYNSKTNQFDRKVTPFNKMIGNLIDLTRIKPEHIDDADGKKATDEAKRYIGNLKERKERFQKISSLIKKGDKKDFIRKTYKKGLINAKNEIKKTVSQKLGTQKTLYWDCEGKDEKLMNERNSILSGSKYIDTINDSYDKNSQNNITYMNKLLKTAQTTPVDCGLSFDGNCDSVNNYRYANNGDANITKYQPQYYGNYIGGYY